MKRILLLSAAILVPAGAGAQERKRPPESGMVMEAGEWRAPTPATALSALLSDDDAGDGLIGKEAAVAVLRQRFGAFSPAELDAFADSLAGVMRHGTNVQAYVASGALAEAWRSDHWQDAERDVPYAGANRVLIRLYESYADSLGNSLGDKADVALYGVMETGGVEYVRRLFEASGQPPPCQHRQQRGGVVVPENPCPNVCTWCQAGDLLLMNGADGAPDEDLWKALCQRLRY